LITILIFTNSTTKEIILILLLYGKFNNKKIPCKETRPQPFLDPAGQPGSRFFKYALSTNAEGN